MEAVATDLLRKMCGCDLPARADEDSMDLDAAQKEHAREQSRWVWTEVLGVVWDWSENA